MELVQKAINVTVGLLEIEFVLWGYPLSFLDLILYMAVGGILVFWIGGMLR